MNDFLSKDDYEEPRCLLNMHPEKASLPLRRILDKLDSYLDRNDYAAAERHLRYWLSEAEACHDSRGRLALLNEQIGLYRKTDRGPECLAAISEALALADPPDTADTVTCATTLINAATGYKAFGKAAEALPLYRRARSIYEGALDRDDERLGGLYNNMALALTDLGEFREARELFQRAVSVMEKQKHGSLEVAVTCLNLADLVRAEAGPEAGEAEIEQYLLRAEELLNAEELPRDGYYAFICEKCAPVFGYYGYFLTERELDRRAREIHERT